MIKPTCGRIVWYYNNKEISDPLPAIIMSIRATSLIDVTVFTYDSPKVCTVPLVQEDEAVPVFGSYCTWMPYQIEAAKK